MAKTKRNFKKLISVVIFICLIIFIMVFCIDFHVRHSVKDNIISLEEAASSGADCILVLGAGVRDDGSPSHMLRDRLETSLSLYNEGASTRILMSGDHGRVEYDEVNVMKAYAVSNGVPSECVFMDHAGFSTYESMYRAKEIFQAENIIVVTQGYHMYRALYIAKSLGLDAKGVTSDQNRYVGQVYRDVREILARIKDFAMCIVCPEPTYLGDTIPISGDGNTTNDNNTYASI